MQVLNVYTYVFQIVKRIQLKIKDSGFDNFQ